jgi:hypothetical protein
MRRAEPSRWRGLSSTNTVRPERTSEASKDHVGIDRLSPSRCRWPSNSRAWRTTQSPDVRHPLGPGREG